MLRRYSKEIASMSSDLQVAIKDLQERYRRGHIADEEDMTARLLENIGNVLTRDFEGCTITTRAVTLSKRTEEPKVGADVLTVMRFEASDFSTSKGFLAQAKVLKQRAKMPTRDWERLKKQCEAMLGFSIESYVWFYSRSSIRVQRAHVMSGLETRTPDEVEYSYLKQFLLHFLLCRHGDPNLNFDDLPRLRAIIEEMRIPFGLFVSVSGKDEPGPKTPIDDGPLDGGQPLDQVLQELDAGPLSTSNEERTTERFGSSFMREEAPENRVKSTENRIRLRTRY